MTMTATVELTAIDEELIRIARTLPPERVTQLDDFARFLAFQTKQAKAGMRKRPRKKRWTSSTQPSGSNVSGTTSKPGVWTPYWPQSMQNTRPAWPSRSEAHDSTALLALS